MIHTTPATYWQPEEVDYITCDKCEKVVEDDLYVHVYNGCEEEYCEDCHLDKLYEEADEVLQGKDDIDKIIKNTKIKWEVVSI